MRVIQVALAIGIAVLLPMMAEMSVRFYAEPPTYDAYQDYYQQQGMSPEERANADKEAQRKSDEYEKAYAAYNLKQFYFTFPLGIIEVVIGSLLLRRPTLAAGVVFGGLSTIAYGSFSSWESLPNWCRFSSLLFALLVIGVLAYIADRKSSRPTADL